MVAIKKWTEANSAARAFKRLMSGDYKSMSLKTLEKYSKHYTDDQVKDVEEIIKARKEECSKRKCRSDAGKPRTTKNVEIKQLLLNNPSSVRETTKKKHVSQWNGMMKEFAVTTPEELVSKYSKEQIVDIIVKRYKGDAQGYIGTLKLIVEDLKPHLNQNGLGDYLKDAKTTAKDVSSVEKIKAREEDDSDYQAMYDALHKGKTGKNHMEDVIISMYTQGVYNAAGALTMVPRSYFSRVHIVDTASQATDKEENYYIPKEGRLIMNHFKTSNVYKYDYVLSKQVREVVNRSLETLPRKWLISKGDGTPYTPTALSSLVGRVLGVSVNLYRHVMENTLMEKGVDLVPLARSLGHSVTTQQTHYLKRKRK